MGRARATSIQYTMAQLIFCILFSIFLTAEFFIVEGRKCACPRKVAVVCAGDGETYLNSCLADCQDQPVVCAGSCPCPLTNSTTIAQQQEQRATSNTSTTTKTCYCRRNIAFVCGEN